MEVSGREPQWEGGAGAGAATVTAEAAVVAVLMVTLPSSSDSPDDESFNSSDSILLPMMTLVGFLKR